MKKAGFSIRSSSRSYVPSIDDPHIDLRLIRAQEGEYLSPRDNRERVTRMQEAHLVLAEMCGNHFMEAIARSMLRLTREIVEAVDPDHDALHAPGEHQTVIEAVLKGDASVAARSMSEHLEKFCERLVKMEEAYRRKVSWDEPKAGLGGD